MNLTQSRFEEARALVDAILQENRQGMSYRDLQTRLFQLGWGLSIYQIKRILDECPIRTTYTQVEPPKSYAWVKLVEEV